MIFCLQKWPRIFDMIASYCRGESVKKASVFTRDEILQFLKEAPNENRYWLIRKVVVTTAFFGGNRLHELRGMTQGSVVIAPEGYEVTFRPAKQRGQVVTSR